MKWFKHDSNASLDAKLKRLKHKYGMEGYGLYWYLLECIARNVEAHNLTYELEEDAELISVEVNIHRDRVEEMMRFMVGQGLFEESGGHITCLKMASRSDEYTQKALRNSKSVRTISVPAPEKVPPIRTDKNRTDKKKRFTPPTLEEVKAYAKEKSLIIDAEDFVDFYESKGWVVGKSPMKSWKASASRWARSNQPTKSEFKGL